MKFLVDTADVAFLDDWARTFLDDWAKTGQSTL